MNSKSKIVTGFTLVAAVLLLGGCGTMSQYNGYVTAPVEAKKVVDEGGVSEEAMAQIAIVQNPDFNGGIISAKALKKIQQYAMSCQQQIDAQLAGTGQSILNGAGPYSVAGGVGTALGAEAAFGKAIHGGDYLKYGGIAYLFTGAVNGAITGSYSMASAKGSCTKEFWDDIVKTDKIFKGTHVVVVHAGKVAGGSIPPALDPAAIPVRSTEQPVSTVVIPVQPEFTPKAAK